MIPGEAKRSDVLSMTLTELAFLLFFLLLFTAVWQIRQIEEEKSLAEIRSESLERQMAGADSVMTLLLQPEDRDVAAIIRQAAERIGEASKIENLQEELFAAASEMERMRNELALVEKSTESLDEEIQRLEEERDGLEELFPQSETLDDDEFVELLREAAQQSGAAAQNEVLREKSDALEAERAELEKSLDSLNIQIESEKASKNQAESISRDRLNQITNLLRRIGGRGSDPPPLLG